jgi:membrane-associated phospholipid phosphatase
MSDARSDYRRFLLPAALMLAAAVAFAVDLPVAMQMARWRNEASPTYSRTIDAYLGYFDIFEPFGHGIGVALMLLALHQLDPARRWAIPRVLACAVAAGLAADLVKMLVVRTRPYDLRLPFDGSVWATFGQWLPGLGGQSGMQSFPSAHTATAAGLAAGLIWLYPQGRFLFTALTVLVGCQRIASRAHFPSDVFIGAAVGCLAAMLVLHVGGLSAWFDRCESRWRGRSRGTCHSERSEESCPNRDSKQDSSLRSE